MAGQDSDPRSQDAALTSHILDLLSGRPAAKIGLRLYAVDSSSARPLTSVVSNDDGRFDAPLLRVGDCAGGGYRLEFDVATHFGPSVAGFFETVPIDIFIDQPACHHHVPLLLSPWGYATYRGAPPEHGPVERPPRFHEGTFGASEAAQPPPSPGSTMAGLTTHVIDTARGCGAGGMRVDVFRHADRSMIHVSGQTTTTEGRTADWLIADGELVPGAYELVFHVGAYYEAVAAWQSAPFFPTVRVRFKVAAARAHLHVPLLVSPWGYTVYRGS